VPPDASVVALEAHCDLVTEDEERDDLATMRDLSAEDLEEALEAARRSATFRVREVALLADGRRLTLGDDRGWRQVSHGIRGETLDPWEGLTRAEVEHGVLSVVDPFDEGIEEDHPCEFFAATLGEQGVAVTADELRGLPYEVVLSERLLARLSG